MKKMKHIRNMTWHSRFSVSFLFVLWSSQFLPVCLHKHTGPNKHTLSDFSTPAALSACISSALIFLSAYQCMND